MDLFHRSGQARPIRHPRLTVTGPAARRTPRSVPIYFFISEEDTIHAASLMEQQKKWDTFYSSVKREPFLHLTDEQVDKILEKFAYAKSALDIGCGEGQLLAQLEKRGISTVGIDVSPVALNEAHKHVKGELIEGDFEQYTFRKDTQFDLIFTKFVIAFIKDVDAFFKKIVALLGPGSGFILLTPVINGPKNENLIEEEIFIQQSVLDASMPRYFSDIKEEVLYAEGDKKLALYVCTKIN